MCRNSRQMVSLRVFSLDLALLLEPTAESQVLFTCVAQSFNFPRGIIIIFFHIIERTYEKVDKNYIQAGTENSQRFQVFPSCSLIFMQ